MHALPYVQKEKCLHRYFDGIIAHVDAAGPDAHHGPRCYSTAVQYKAFIIMTFSQAPAYSNTATLIVIIYLSLPG